MAVPAEQLFLVPRQIVTVNSTVTLNATSTVTSRLPLHPFLFAVYPAFALYAHNADISRPDHIIVPVLLSLVLVTIALLVAQLALRNLERAAVTASVFTLLFFSYGHVYNYATRHIFRVVSVTGGGTDSVLVSRIWLHSLLSALWVFILALVFLYEYRSRKTKPYAATPALNAVSVVLMLFPLAGFARSFIGDARPLEARPGHVELAVSTEKPDIYYIILDGYARADVLQKHYAFDNREFLGFLTEKGFVVSPNSHSNYAWTFLSLPSSLNFQYLGFLSSKENRRSSDRSIPYSLLRDNEALRFLRLLGYRYIHIGSTWGGTLDNPHADMQFNCSGKLFEIDLHRVLAESTWLKVLEQRIAEDLADCSLQSLAKLGASGSIQGPKFVFAHIPMPHHPYIFDRNGNVLKRIVLSDQVDRQEQLWTRKEDYLEQLLFVNAAIERVVSEILAVSPRQPVIIIQSDHGPNLPQLDKEERRKVRHRNIAAFLLPGNKATIPDDITPVNELRIIFNAYLGGNFEILPNVFYHSSYEKPYRFDRIAVE